MWGRHRNAPHTERHTTTTAFLLMSSRPPTPGGGGGAPPPAASSSSGLNGTIKFLKVNSRGGTPAMKHVYDAVGLGDDEDVEEVDYNVEDIFRMAEHLGMDTDRDEAFLWIAAEAYDAPVPPPWREFFDESGEVYFHNSRTGGVTRDHPLDHYYRILYGIVRQMADKGLEVDVEAARRDAAMALPDQTMNKAIEESKANVQSLAHSSAAIAKYVQPQRQSASGSGSDLEGLVGDLQAALRQAEEDRRAHERRVKDLSVRVVEVQRQSGETMSEDLLKSLHLKGVASTSAPGASAEVEAVAVAAQSPEVARRLSHLEQSATDAAMEAMRAHRERADAQAESAGKIEGLIREAAQLKERLRRAEEQVEAERARAEEAQGRAPQRAPQRDGECQTVASGSGAPHPAQAAAAKAPARAGLDGKQVGLLRELGRRVAEAKREMDELRRDTLRQTERTVTALAAPEALPNDPMAGLVSTLLEKAADASDAARNWEKKIGPVVAERRRLFNELLRIKGNIRVFCRVRPLNAQEDGVSCVEFPNDDMANKSVALITEDKQQSTQGSAGRQAHRKEFEFDRVFDERCSQVQVFEESVQPLVQSALDGFNVCVFAYGQTGSGKTHTMEGPPHDPGVTRRTIDELFRVANAECAVPGIEYAFTLSMLEIYNEQIRDLLCPGGKASGESHSHPGMADRRGSIGGGTDRKLDIRMEEDGSGVYVTDLTSVCVTNPEEVVAYLKEGSSNRSVGITKMNEHSSRSHLVMIIRCTVHNTLKNTSVTSKISLIDLAGSERVAKSGVEGERLREAVHINKSLSALGDVISSLSSRSRSTHVPFRNSKLTYLLSDSLGNECKTMLFVNVSPAAMHSHESLCSLMFASRARNVDLSSTSASAGSIRKWRDAADMAKKQQKRLDTELVSVSKELESAKDGFQHQLTALRRELKMRDEKIADLQASRAQSAPLPPSYPPPPLPKPMRQHNGKGENGAVPDMTQQFMDLKQTNKKYSDRISSLREEKAKLQKELNKRDEALRELSEKFRRVSSIQRANAAVSNLKANSRPNSRSRSRPATPEVKS